MLLLASLETARFPKLSILTPVGRRCDTSPVVVGVNRVAGVGVPLAVRELAANLTTEGPPLRIMPSFENHRSPAVSKTRPHGPSMLAKVALLLELSVTSAKTSVGLATVPPRSECGRC
jgi:hypothetical protein